MLGKRDAVHFWLFSNICSLSNVLQSKKLSLEYRYIFTKERKSFNYGLCVLLMDHTDDLKDVIPLTIFWLWSDQIFLCQNILSREMLLWKHRKMKLKKLKFFDFAKNALLCHNKHPNVRIIATIFILLQPGTNFISTAMDLFHDKLTIFNSFFFNLALNLSTLQGIYF